MKKLLFALLFAAAPALATTPDLQLYTANAQGSLTIGADGSVLEVELTSEGNLGKEVLAGFEQRIRAWRFEPITEDGQPVNAKGRMSLSLVAARRKGVDTATFGIRRVQFLDPPGTPVARAGSGVSPPRYPSEAAREGIGARVVLLLKLDAQGAVTQAAAERLELLGVSPNRGQLDKLGERFSRSAELMAVKWTFAGYQEGDLLRVPVSFMPPGYSGGWVPTVIRQPPVPDWMVIELAREQATDLGAGGVALSTQFKLLTPLDET